MKYQFHKSFVKDYRKLSKKLQQKVEERLGFFAKDPFDSFLENHPLQGTYAGYRSINITGDYRAIYKQLSNVEVIFVKIGTHAGLYG